jgi:hypothetical protein
METILTENCLFVRWLSGVAHTYEAVTSAPALSKNNTKCYFGHIYKVVKAIYSVSGNFLQTYLDEDNEFAVDSFELFYGPMYEIEKIEFSSNSDNKSEVFDNDSDRFDELEDVESDSKDEMTTPRGGNEFPFQSKILEPLIIVDEEEAPKDEYQEASSDGMQIYSDLLYWKMHIKHEDQSINDLLN